MKNDEFVLAKQFSIFGRVPSVDFRIGDFQSGDIVGIFQQVRINIGKMSNVTASDQPIEFQGEIFLSDTNAAFRGRS